MAEIIPFRPRRRPPPADWRELYRRIWAESLDRLTQHLVQMTEETIMDDLKIDAPAGEPVVTFTRTLNAPRELVWRALSQPEHVIAWWGPNGYTNEVLQFDFRVGGHWRIRTLAKEGAVEFFGDYLEIERPRTVTQTFAFDQLPPGVHSVDTVVLEEKDGKTIYRASSRFPDIASRDGMIASGMEVGVREGFGRLDQMLEDWKAHA